MSILLKDIKELKEEIPKTSGIYKITNLLNGNFYIGQSCNLRERAFEHLNSSKKTSKSILYSSIKKHKIENFKYEVLELCEYDKLPERELHYIMTLNPQYNIVKSLQPKKGYHRCSEEMVIKIYDLKNKGLNSVQISKKIKTTKKIVRDILHKKTYAHVIEKYNLKINEVKNNDQEVIELIKLGFLNVDIRLFYPKYNNRRISKLKLLNNVENGDFYISEEEYFNHLKNIGDSKNLKKYCIENNLPISKFKKMQKNITIKRISDDLIFKIYDLAKNNTKRKEISNILGIPFREVIEVLREDGRSKYTDFKKLNNLYIERKRNFRKNVNQEHEKIVLGVFDLYKKGMTLTEISENINIRYGMVHKILFNKNRYCKIKEKHNLNLNQWEKVLHK